MSRPRRGDCRCATHESSRCSRSPRPRRWLPAAGWARATSTPPTTPPSRACARRSTTSTSPARSSSARASATRRRCSTSARRSAAAARRSTSPSTRSRARTSPPTASRTRSPCSRSRPKGTLLHAPDTYMKKIAVGPEAADAVHIDATPTENIRNVAKALKRDVEDLVVCILERERHIDLIREVRAGRRAHPAHHRRRRLRRGRHRDRGHRHPPLPRHRRCARRRARVRGDEVHRRLLHGPLRSGAATRRRPAPVTWAPATSTTC